jgi:oligosaccharide reducing-end xylanase
MKRLLSGALMSAIIMGAAPLQGLAQGLPPISPPNPGAYASGEYRNMLALWGLSDEEIQARIDQAWQQLFYGNDSSQRVYYPVGEDMAYVLDTGNSDVRSEGMSYGMMIAVQLDKKEEFDRIWKWAKTYMYQSDGPYKGYFAWHCQPDGTQIDANPAPDGEEWFVMALFFAAARWGNGTGIFDYEAEANAILYTMLHKSDAGGVVGNMFHEDYHMVVFVPSGESREFTDPSYHLPHYYELWGLWAAQDNAYWLEAANVSRAFWKTTAHLATGLMPDYAQFTGEPKHSGDYGEYFYADAWRNAMNVAVDYAWFAADPWEIEQSNRLLDFFYKQGVTSYADKYPIDGSEALTPWHSEGLVAMNAVATLATTDTRNWAFIEDFWNTAIPTGQWRYYSGLLYMFALLHLSGNFQIYDPTIA